MFQFTCVRPDGPRVTVGDSRCPAPRPGQNKPVRGEGWSRREKSRHLTCPRHLRSDRDDQTPDSHAQTLTGGPSSGVASGDENTHPESAVTLTSAQATEGREFSGLGVGFL